MKQKPSLKSIIIINLVNNIPMSIVMSITAPLLMGIPLVPSKVITNICIAFVLACIINLVVPIPLIANNFPKIFNKDPNSFAGGLIANIPIALIFVVIIGLLLNLYNVRAVPDFIFAFLATFLPLYIVCFIISMITNPIAQKLAFKDR